MDRPRISRAIQRHRHADCAGPGGVAIIDPGPTTCLGTLEQGLQAHGIRWEDVRHLMLTHIHLDHAGAAGTIVREHPHITVLVHERGAPHMIDPSRLLDSATRVYGNDMDRLWGEFASVPQTQDRLVVRRGKRSTPAGGPSMSPTRRATRRIT